MQPPETDPIISPFILMAIWPPIGLGALPQVEMTVANATFLFSLNHSDNGVMTSSNSSIVTLKNIFQKKIIYVIVSNFYILSYLYKRF
jgi:hypothetical protein